MASIAAVNAPPVTQCNEALWPDPGIAFTCLARLILYVAGYFLQGARYCTSLSAMEPHGLIQALPSHALQQVDANKSSAQEHKQLPRDTYMERKELCRQANSLRNACILT